MRAGTQKPGSSQDAPHQIVNSTHAQLPEGPAHPWQSPEANSILEFKSSQSHCKEVAKGMVASLPVMAGCCGTQAQGKAALEPEGCLVSVGPLFTFAGHVIISLFTGTRPWILQLNLGVLHTSGPGWILNLQ
jgi:hypothetical protein